MDQNVATNAIAPSIKCSTCDVDVPLSDLAEHVCGQLVSTQIVDEPGQIEPMHTQYAARPGKSSKPSLPKLDPFAPARSPTYGELTPASSGPGSAAVSPISPGRRSPFLHPPRKVSVPVRRPPSPELLSQDCAFPPFPNSKAKRKEAVKGVKDKSRSNEATSSQSFDQQRSRSASFSAIRSRSRHGTAESSRPSTANSSRQASLSSRAGSRQGSIDVPPLPPLQPVFSNSPSDPGSSTSDYAHSLLTAKTIEQPILQTLSARTSSRSLEQHDSEPSTKAITDCTPSVLPESSQRSLKNRESPQEPAYKTKRPPPISNLPASGIEDFHIPKAEPSPLLSPIPPTPGNTITRTLTNFFGRKRNPSTSSKKSTSKAPVTNGPRFVALSPDPDPQETPILESLERDSINEDTTAMSSTGEVQEAPRTSVDIQTVQHIPEPSHAPILQPDDASDYGDLEENDQQIVDTDSHDEQRDTMQLERDLEQRLAAMAVVPHLSVINEKSEDLKRVSNDSASSYGSVGLSYSSQSTRSFQGFEGHSQGSSISTARTASTTDELLLFPKPRIVDTVPDSPTDPYMHQASPGPVLDISESSGSELDSYLQNSRLSTVHEVLSSLEEEKPEPFVSVVKMASTSLGPEPDSYGFPLPIANVATVTSPSASSDDGALSPLNQLRQRRPSTPGAFRGICRGCSKSIVGGQKSVSSKDGQLTGRYHKECFACMTCKEPFATADFYVHNDQPYCAQHYHEVNDTLCEGCGKGIEGQYLETSNVARVSAKKYHPDCLQCATCKVQLDADYFELAGRVYCEKDAFRMANGPRSPYGTMPSRPSPLNREYISSNEPGHVLSAGRFPERRLTKLMTTF